MRSEKENPESKCHLEKKLDHPYGIAHREAIESLAGSAVAMALISLLKP